MLQSTLATSPKLISSPSGAAEHSVNSTAMPRQVGSWADGSADEVAELQSALARCETKCLELQAEVAELREQLTRVAQLEDRIRALETQNEAPPPRPAAGGVVGDVRRGYRVCKNYQTCGLQFRCHRPEEYCCSSCRNGFGHSGHCGQRSRPFHGEN